MAPYQSDLCASSRIPNDFGVKDLASERKLCKQTCVIDNLWGGPPLTLGMTNVEGERFLRSTNEQSKPTSEQARRAHLRKSREVVESSSYEMPVRQSLNN